MQEYLKELSRAVFINYNYHNVFWQPSIKLILLSWLLKLHMIFPYFFILYFFSFPQNKSFRVWFSLTPKHNKCFSAFIFLFVFSLCLNYSSLLYAHAKIHHHVWFSIYFLHDAIFLIALLSYIFSTLKYDLNSITLLLTVS